MFFQECSICFRFRVHFSGKEGEIERIKYREPIGLIYQHDLPPDLPSVIPAVYVYNTTGSQGRAWWEFSEAVRLGYQGGILERYHRCHLYRRYLDEVYSICTVAQVTHFNWIVRKTFKLSSMSRNRLPVVYHPMLRGVWPKEPHQYDEVRRNYVEDIVAEVYH